MWTCHFVSGRQRVTAVMPHGCSGCMEVGDRLFSADHEVVSLVASGRRQQHGFLARSPSEDMW